ncbi:MAG: LuxR family transcriptional regulator [Spirochaetaceae bacterium]|nr:MAG: LuxR family transcriptional regulator [Spirochaetaceae bacterium]
MWSLALNFVFFSVNLMEQPDVGLAAVLVWIRLAISLVVGWLAPLLLYSLGPGRLRRRHALLALLLPALTVAVVFLLGNYPLVLKLFTGLFNGGLGLASLLVLFFRLEKNEFRGFLLVHGVILCLYGLFGLATIPWPAIAPSELTGFLTGLFLVAWSINDIRVFLRNYAGADGAAVPARFFEHYGLTQREADVLEQLLQGRAHKEAAAAMGISPRTAESHVYRLYRKCGVGNRVELINLVRSFQ